MRRVLLAAPWALWAFCAVIPESYAADVAQCVQVAPENVPQGVSLEVHNTCDLAVRCTLKWRVRCDGDAADAAPRNMSVSIELASDGKRTLMASGEACGARIWEITDDAWECREVP
jgi:hypothetical protein